MISVKSLVSIRTMMDDHFSTDRSPHNMHLINHYNNVITSIDDLTVGPLTWEIPDSNSSGFSPLGFTILALVLNMAFVSEDGNTDMWVTYNIKTHTHSVVSYSVHYSDMDPTKAPANLHVPQDKPAKC